PSACATCSEMPFAETVRWAQGPGVRTLDGSGACFTSAGGQLTRRGLLGLLGPQRRSGLLDAVDGAFRRLDLAHPLVSQERAQAGDQQHDAEDDRERRPPR